MKLVLRKGIQAKMRKMLDSEIEERRGDLIEDLKDLVSYLENGKNRYPTYSESGAEGLEDAFRQFDSIKSRYTFEPRIIKSTILVIVSCLILILFWVNPTLWVSETETTTFTLAHIGIGFLAIGLWMILDMLVVSLEIQPWEYEEKEEKEFPPPHKSSLSVGRCLG